MGGSFIFSIARVGSGSQICIAGHDVYFAEMNTSSFYSYTIIHICGDYFFVIAC